MELLQLRYFQVVARVGHMTNAAQELRIAQPSLSKTIQRLEKEVGVPLFDRRGRSIQLNQFGRTFLGYVETVFLALDEGGHHVRDLAGLEKGEVSIAAASLYWLPDLLSHFRDKYPLIHFQLAQRPLTAMAQELERGTCDFCFQSLPLRKPGIEWQTLLEEDVLLVVPPKHLLAQEGSVPWSRITEEDIIIEPVGSGLRDLIDQYCSQAGVKLHIAYQINEPAALLEFVSASLGLGFVPAQMREQIETLGLVSLRVTEPRCRRTFGMAWHKQHYLSQAAQTFQRFATSYFAELEQDVSPLP